MNFMGSLESSVIDAIFGGCFGENCEKYPFEMLTFTEQIWRTWLNPGSNLNRYRITDYRRAFQIYFKKVDIAVLERDRYAFEQIRNRIRPEFITGDIETDAATQIRVVAYA